MNSRRLDAASRRQFLVRGLAATGACLPLANRSACGDSSASIRTTDAQSLVAKLSRFLWLTQSDDGRWSSRTYAVLGSGQALTPFVLYSLLEADPSNSHDKRADSAINWIRRHLRDGMLGLADPDVLEYPVFATSFALRCLLKVPSADSDNKSTILRKRLIGEQFTQRRGFRKSDLAYGGWGFGGKHPPGQTGHMDLSHTRWVLAALAQGDIESNHQDRLPYQSKAELFLRLLQKHPDEDRVQPIGDGSVQQRPPYDGGFYFSPIVVAANKGRVQRDGDRVHFRSYATATCDGLLALLACGNDHSDERVAAARRWLEKHPDWEYPAGIPKEHPEPWGDAVYFYHQAVRAEAYFKLGIEGNWAERLVDRLESRLQPDGSIYNQRSPLMKENDPILCSSLALIAANYANRQLRQT